jgi:hypothetical protein
VRCSAPVPYRLCRLAKYRYRYDDGPMTSKLKLVKLRTHVRKRPESLISRCSTAANKIVQLIDISGPPRLAAKTKLGASVMLRP